MTKMPSALNGPQGGTSGEERIDVVRSWVERTPSNPNEHFEKLKELSVPQAPGRPLASGDLESREGPGLVNPYCRFPRAVPSPITSFFRPKPPM